MYLCLSIWIPDRGGGRLATGAGLCKAVLAGHLRRMIGFLAAMTGAGFPGGHVADGLPRLLPYPGAGVSWIPQTELL